jgi:hypothetical protein
MFKLGNSTHGIMWMAHMCGVSASWDESNSLRSGLVVFNLRIRPQVF